jgi:NAD-dependent dihydropyrimidine dehydrogenase PreA subunit
MTTLKKLPTTAPPNNRRMTGILIAQTRGGKSDWSGWESSTKGCNICISMCVVKVLYWRERYHQKRPDGVVEED